MNRVLKKAKSKEVTYFSTFDADDPLLCIPETSAETEKRIFTWNLLCRIFTKNKLMFNALVLYDCLSVFVHSFKYNYLAPEGEADDEYREWLDVRMSSSESFQQLRDRMDQMISNINLRGAHTLTMTNFRSAILKAVKTNSYWMPIEAQAEMNRWTITEILNRFTEYGKKEVISQRKMCLSPEDEAAALKKKKQSDHHRNQVLNNKAAKAIKATERAAIASAKAATAATLAASAQGAPKATVKTRECFNHKKWGLCPRGNDCNFKHDPQDGPRDATSVPDGYKCRFCDKNH